MNNLHFDEESHPELLDVPLKGKFLRDFAAMVAHDGMANEYANKIGAVFADKTGTQEEYAQTQRDSAPVDRMMKHIYSQLAARLGNKALEEHGVTLRELPALVSDIVSLEQQYDTTHDTADALHQMSQLPREFAPHELADITENQVLLSLRQHFSRALAVQEGREKDFEAMQDEYYSDARRTMAGTAIEARESSMEAVAGGASGVIMLKHASLERAAAAAGRASPSYKLLKREAGLVAELSDQYVGVATEGMDRPTLKSFMKFIQELEKICRDVTGPAKSA